MKYGPPTNIIVFTSKQTTPFVYEYENGEVGSDISKFNGFVWIKVPVKLNPYDTVTLLAYNISGVKATTGDNVFILYDDFNDGVFNSNLWSTSFCDVVENYGFLFVTPSDNTKNNIVISKINITRPVVVEMSGKMDRGFNEYDDIGLALFINQIFSNTGHPQGYTGSLSQQFFGITKVTSDDSEISLNRKEINLELDQWMLFRFAAFENGTLLFQVNNKKILANDLEYNNGTIGLIFDLDNPNVPAIINWVRAYFSYDLNITIKPADDKDNDGLPDPLENIKNTNPNNADSDNDGIPDGWEVYYNLNPLDPSDASIDNDNDGLSNIEEYQHHTDPNNPDSDGDNFSDGVEVLLMSDPCNPYEPIITIIITISIIIIAIYSFLYYRRRTFIRKIQEISKRLYKF